MVVEKTVTNTILWIKVNRSKIFEYCTWDTMDRFLDFCYLHERMNAMKKALGIFLLLFAIMVYDIAFASSVKNENEIQLKSISYSKTNIPNEKFKLPEYIQIIEEEAFEGTAIENIVLPRSVSIIGEKAFANISTLKTVQIPLTTLSIAPTVFTGSDNVMIMAASNSFARDWAKENDVPFIVLTVICERTGNLNLCDSSISISSKKSINEKTSDTRIGKRILDNNEEEKITKTNDIIASQVQGRSPPNGRRSYIISNDNR